MSLDAAQLKISALIGEFLTAQQPAELITSAKELPEEHLPELLNTVMLQAAEGKRANVPMLVRLVDLLQGSKVLVQSTCEKG